MLQKEAERERAAYLTPPLEQKAFLTAVASLLSSYNPARRSPRKRVCSRRRWTASSLRWST